MGGRGEGSPDAAWMGVGDGEVEGSSACRRLRHALYVIAHPQQSLQQQAAPHGTRVQGLG